MKSHVTYFHFQRVQNRFRLYLFPSEYWLFSCYHEDIVTDLINPLPGNSFVNTYTGNNRRETVFSMLAALSKITDIYEVYCQATQR
jgi:hypothetical protein